MNEIGFTADRTPAYHGVQLRPEPQRSAPAHHRVRNQDRRRKNGAIVQKAVPNDLDAIETPGVEEMILRRTNMPDYESSIK